ncbi:hypothetical protein [Streptomyces albipurpureus]|uniref:Uncharacterized protein n=1 Tax=Streptomyces albipurpureus TaxID=2897419 RepID=A0ABT0UU20_9ACTN|nr:hypothetical protein [Streptomyces sp. CWNU-1]MCM2391746.1 hypothetical protein [Streptomyces sp. CWNU-1]
MTAIHTIEDANAPALGDLRNAGPDDCVYVFHSATSRKDWPKYWEAVGVAFSRGAFVHVVNREES